MEGTTSQGASSRPGGGGAPGSSSTGSGSSAQAQGAGGRMGSGGNAGAGGSPGASLPMSGGMIPQQGQGQHRPLSTTGGTSTSTQHSSYLQQGQMQGSGGGASSSGGSLQMQQGQSSSFDDIALRLGGPGFVGAYSPEQRRMRIEKFIEKRGRRVWTKKVKYDVRKNFADSRLRVKVRCRTFVTVVFYGSSRVCNIALFLLSGALRKEGRRGHNARNSEHIRTAGTECCARSSGGHSFFQSTIMQSWCCVQLYVQIYMSDFKVKFMDDIHFAIFLWGVN